jgi:hypothetical protein
MYKEYTGYKEGSHEISGNSRHGYCKHKQTLKSFFHLSSETY